MKNKLLIISMLFSLFIPKINFGQAPTLGTSANFVLFTASGSFTNVGASYITGDIGNYSGAYSAFPPGTLVGTAHIADSTAFYAAADVGTAYGYMSGITCDTTIGTTLGYSQVLTPRVYCMGAASTLTDTLFLDAQGNASAIFIFKIDGALSTSTHAYVILLNSASMCNVYWQINGAFTLDDSSVFEGTILCSKALSFNTGSSLHGRGLSTSGAISTSAVIATIPSSCLATAPTITSQPASHVTCLGSSVTFHVTATGTALTYQWRKGTTNISGKTSSTYTISSVGISDTASNYNVVVSGSVAPSVTSSNASLTLNQVANIATAPTNQTACLGNSATFSVTATGTALTYQWRKGTTNIIGAISDSFKINSVTISDTSANYNVMVYGACSSKDSSSNVSLTINTQPSITTQPTNQVVCPSVGTMVHFSVAASGTGITYQWRKGTVNLSNVLKISGATSATLTINTANISDTASNYNVVISGTCSPSITSANVSLDISTISNITTAPVNQTACVGSSATFSVAALGAGLTYQWRKGSVNIASATSASYTISTVAISDTASNYNVVISGTCSSNITSSNVSLTINTAPLIITSPSNQTICAGSSATFSVAATGTALTYHWRKGTTNITGATSDTFKINSVNISDTASNYNVVVSGTCSPNITTANVSLNVNTAPAITLAPSSKAICSGSSVTFNVTATGTSLAYQWRKGTVNISGAISSSLTINPANISDAASNYNVVISGTCSPIVTSSNVSLTVNVAPAITSAPTNQAACLGTTAKLSVVATGTSLTYQWRKDTINLTNGGGISGATSASLTITSVKVSDANAKYNVVISGTCSPDITTTNVSLTINLPAEIITQPTSQMSTDSGAVSFSVVASGGGLTYHWRKGIINLTNGGTISGATTAKLTINPVGISDTSSYYNVVISSPCSSDIISENQILFVCVCYTTGVSSLDGGSANETVKVYPNPFTTSINAVINDASKINEAELRIYNVLGAEIMNTTVTKLSTTLETSNLPSGIYFFRVTVNNKTIQSGKLIAQ